MKVKKIIFFVSTIFNKRDFHRFGFDIIKKNGYKVEVWDFSPWINLNYYNNYKPPDPIFFDGYKIFYNVEQIKHSLINLSQEDLIIDPFKILKNKIIFEFLMDKKIKIGTLQLGLLPAMIAKNYFDHIKRMLYFLYNDQLEFVRILFLKILTFFSRTKTINIYNFCLVGGKIARNNFKNKLMKNIDIINIHAFDYDRYLEEENKVYAHDSISNLKYSVFLDEAIPFHPDYLIQHSLKKYCSTEIYYSEINNFFSRYETDTGNEVLIAAHPRADYKKRGNPFNKRRLIQGQTTHLVKYAEHVFAHMSTSVNFAVLYKKPVIVIDSNNYIHLFRYYIKLLSKSLDVKPLNISEPLYKEYSNPMINELVYNNYKEQYIKTTNTPDVLIWEYFCNYIKKFDS